jgi:hypothetical protein
VLLTLSSPIRKPLAVSVIKNKMIMSRIVLISCVSRKGKTKTKAKDLYKGPLFNNSLAYGQSLKPDKIFILSALHNLLDLDKEIEPYDVTLSYVSPKKRKEKPNLKVLTKAEANSWGKKVIEQLGEVADLKNDKFIILAGQDYLTPIQNSLTNIEEPLKGVGMFERPKKLKELIKKINGK